MWAPLTVTMVVAVEVPWQVMGWVLIAMLLAILLGVIVASSVYVYIYVEQEWRLYKKEKRGDPSGRLATADEETLYSKIENTTPCTESWQIKSVPTWQTLH